MNRPSHSGLTVMRLQGMRDNLEQVIEDAVTGFVRASGIIVTGIAVTVADPDNDRLTATATVAVSLDL